MTLLASWPTPTDDDGTGQTGTFANAAWAASVKSSIEDQVHSSTNTTTKPKAITDEVITARGIYSTLNDRLNAIGTTNMELSGGLIVGFDGTPVDDRIQIGDANFRVDFNSGTPQVVFDTSGGSDYVQYDRTNNEFEFVIGNVDVAKLSASGLEVYTGLVVGFVATPSADVVQVGNALFGLDYNGGTPRFIVDTDDYFTFTRASNQWDWVIGGTIEMSFNASGLQVGNGLQVGFYGTPTDDAIEIGAATFRILNAGTPSIQFNNGAAADPRLYWDGTRLEFTVTSGSPRYPLKVSASGIAVGGASGGGSFGGGVGVISLLDATTAPVSNPTAGCVIYSTAGAGTCRGSGGTVTTFGPAEPHCERCGRDAAWEWQNEDEGWHIAVCAWCLMTALEAAGVKSDAFLMKREQKPDKAPKRAVRN